MSNIYYDQINRMAKVSWKGEKDYKGEPKVTMDNWHQWTEHWRKVGYEWIAFEHEKGNSISANRIAQIMNEQ